VQGKDGGKPASSRATKRYIAIRQNWGMHVCMNHAVKLSKNGRITVPKELQDKHSWTKDTVLKWTVNGDLAEVGAASRSPSH
jgi:phytoene/squalene synthetase